MLASVPLLAISGQAGKICEHNLTSWQSTQRSLIAESSVKFHGAAPERVAAFLLCAPHSEDVMYAGIKPRRAIAQPNKSDDRQEMLRLQQKREQQNPGHVDPSWVNAFWRRMAS